MRRRQRHGERKGGAAVTYTVIGSFCHCHTASEMASGDVKFHLHLSEDVKKGVLHRPGLVSVLVCACWNHIVLISIFVRSEAVIVSLNKYNVWLYTGILTKIPL